MLTLEQATLFQHAAAHLDQIIADLADEQDEVNLGKLKSNLKQYIMRAEFAPHICGDDNKDKFNLYKAEISKVLSESNLSELYDLLPREWARLTPPSYSNPLEYGSGKPSTNHVARMIWELGASGQIETIGQAVNQLYAGRLMDEWIGYEIHMPETAMEKLEEKGNIPYETAREIRSFQFLADNYTLYQNAVFANNYELLEDNAARFTISYGDQIVKQPRVIAVHNYLANNAQGQYHALMRGTARMLEHAPGLTQDEIIEKIGDSLARAHTLHVVEPS